MWTLISRQQITLQLLVVANTRIVIRYTYWKLLQYSWNHLKSNNIEFTNVVYRNAEVIIN